MGVQELHVEGIGTILAEGMEMADDELFVINPTEEAMAALVDTLWNTATSPDVRLFADEHSLKTVLDDFLLASRMADLVADGTLAVRTLRDVPRASLLLTEGTLVSIVEAGDDVAGLVSSQGEFVTSTYEAYDAKWRRASAFSIRTPPLSEIRETMAEEIGEQAVDDLERMLEVIETRPDDGRIDEVTLTLLVAAKNRELLYDISRWGEGIQLASKATFSRTKKELEAQGVIDTVKVPIEVGRPRLRLVLGDSTLEEAEPKALLEHVERTLA